MKKLLTLLLIFTATPAVANDHGAWVKVDSNGNAIGQAIVCTYAVCGDPESLYNKLTLLPGEKYILQTVADENGNVAGIGAGQRGNTEVKVDLQTQEWTATTKETVVIKPTPITTASEPVSEPTTSPKVEIVAETTVIEKINKDATTTVISQNAELDTKINETPPVSSDEEKVRTWYDDFADEWALLFQWLEQLFKGWVWTW